MAARPTKYPEMATADIVDPISGQNNKVEPPAEFKQYGYGEQFAAPVRNWENFQGNLVSDWIKYLDETTLSVRTTNGNGAGLFSTTDYGMFTILASIKGYPSYAGGVNYTLPPELSTPGTYAVAQAVPWNPSRPPATDGFHLWGMGMKIPGQQAFVQVLSNKYIFLNLSTNGVQNIPPGNVSGPPTFPETDLPLIGVTSITDTGGGSTVVTITDPGNVLITVNFYSYV